MGLIDRIKRAFSREPAARIAPQPPRLRNKPGGMAWINSRITDESGAEVLVGRAVKTVELTEHGMWRVDPPQHYFATAPTLAFNGQVALPGQLLIVLGIADTSLDPWKDDGGVTDAEVRELYRSKSERARA